MPRRLNKVFIDVEVDESAKRRRARRQARGSLPRRHLRDDRRGVAIVEQNLDECVLCSLCIEAAPAGTVHVRKLYDGTELE